MTLTTETWLPVVGFEGFYEVSDWGRVRSVEREVAGGRGGVQRRRGRVLSPYRRVDLREFVNLSKQGRARPCAVSLLVLEAFVGPRPAGAYGCHNDGSPANNRVDNLRWDTPSNNNFDRVAHGNDRQVRKTHCPRGHRLALPNLVARKARRGHRECLACSRARHSTSGDFRARADDHYARIAGPRPE